MVKLPAIGQRSIRADNAGGGAQVILEIGNLLAGMGPLPYYGLK
jgi:hypothetical protein